MSNSPTILSNLARYVIYYSKHEFNKYTQGFGIFFVKKVIQYTFGDYTKISLLSTIIGRCIYIVFDYNNLDYKSTC